MRREPIFLVFGISHFIFVSGFKGSFTTVAKKITLLVGSCAPTHSIGTFKLRKQFNWNNTGQTIGFISVSEKLFIKASNMLKHLLTEVMRAPRLISYTLWWSARQEVKQIPNTSSTSTLTNYWQKGTILMFHNRSWWQRVNKDCRTHFHTWNLFVAV